MLSVVDKLELPIDIPHHSTFSRRARKRDKMTIQKVKHDPPIHILIDSTAVKVRSGNLREPPKKPAWRKSHVTIDAKAGFCLRC
jgi:hypothetical protein